MRTYIQIGLMLLPALFTDTAYAYGSGVGSKACEKPSFSEFQPAPGSLVPFFSDFSFTASPITSAASIVVGISSGALKYAFKAKDLQIATQKNGALKVKGRLEKPLHEGFVRVSIAAQSQSGCANADGYLLKLGTAGR
jgi:hypothetical protein